MSTPKEEQKHTDLLPSDRLHNLICDYKTTKDFLWKHDAAKRSDELTQLLADVVLMEEPTRKADCHEELVSALQEALAALKHCSKSFSAISEQAQKMGMSLSDPEIIANLGLTISETVDVLARATNHQGSK